ncbi:GntR family transcriptional regulator [Pseudooceanicola sp. HF7]|uniref:GntR family transcriptional regulator n=1 Tax=Pseudooceanicola sp. HF7 TaxID=2721560 RepID=UPI0014320767|nr:GntR family transcriptional regulator [Pseudooceanicola sp. HF7]NIZ11159.1 GntR family transcriptional regulator [Pseudooceanicola sp. HF7]
MKKTSAEIAVILRERICLYPGPGEMLLHEGQLAEEFGLSRTPIRQVLQMLSYEGLVETRSGVGTIATPLRPERREADEAAFRALLGAGAACPVTGRAVLEDVLGLLRKSRAALDQQDGTPEARLYRALAWLLEATTMLVDDNVIVTAMRAATLRHIRWLVAELREGTFRDPAAEYGSWLDQAIRLAESKAPDVVLSHLANRRH